MRKRSYKIGDKFNMLTVIGFSKIKIDRENRYKAKCRCDCGKETLVHPSKLKNGHTKRCGCLKFINNGSRTHGMSSTPIYKLWGSMKGRCNPNSNKKESQNYRDKGIKVCSAWYNDFSIFYDWANSKGYKRGLHLDRIDPNGNYEPSNCQFINQKENLEKVKSDRRTKIKLLNRIDYLETLLDKNNISYDKKGKEVVLENGLL